MSGRLERTGRVSWRASSRGVVLAAALFAMGCAGDRDESEAADGGGGSTGGEGATGGMSSGGVGGGTNVGSGGATSSGGAATSSGGSGGGSGQETCLPIDEPLLAPTLVDAACSHMAFALDRQGSAHFFVVKGSDASGTATGHYVNNRSGSFETTPVDEEQGRIRSSSIAVDDDGAVHIAYDKITGSTVRYASDVSGEWVVEVVGEAVLGGAESTLALAPDGTPSVAYSNSNSNLVLATLGSDGWSASQVAGGSADAIGLWFDADGTPHVTARGCEVHSFDGSDWLSSSPETGHWCSLARPDDGLLHLSYVVPGSADMPHQLRHTIEQSPGAWEASALVYETTLAEIGEPHSVVGPDGTLYVVFAVEAQFKDGCGVHIATLAPSASEFSVRRVAEDGSAPRLQLDTEGNLYLGYCGSEGAMLARIP